MAANLPPTIRNQVQLEAYELDIFGVPQSEIARRLTGKYQAVSRQTINALIKRERAARIAALKESADQALADYIDVNRWVARDAVSRLEETAANAQNVPGLQANILTASKNVATVLGLLTSKGENAANVTINLGELMQAPVTIDYPDPDTLDKPKLRLA